MESSGILKDLESGLLTHLDLFLHQWVVYKGFLELLEGCCLLSILANKRGLELLEWRVVIVR